MTQVAENQKIAERMAGKAAERKARRVSTREAVKSGTRKIAPVEEVNVSVQDAQNIVAAGIGVGPRVTVVGHDVSGLPEGKARTPKKAKVAPKPKAEKVVTVREDPVDNLFLIRMRAKWAAIREDRRTARAEEAFEVSPSPETEKAVEIAREKSRKAWEVEAKAMAAFRKARDARKVAAKKAASKVGKTAAPVASPEAEVVVEVPEVEEA